MPTEMNSNRTRKYLVEESVFRINVIIRADPSSFRVRFDERFSPDVEYQT